MTVNYGQDAPGLMRGFLAGGFGAVALALAAGLYLPGQWAVGVALLAALAAAYLLGMGSFMIFESRIGKVRDRDTILSRLPWRGDEQVLDVGCGRGLMLLGAASRLSTGHATGIDLWRAEDQAANSPEATLANARALGLEDRVSVTTGDMTALPFKTMQFDILLSAWALHNVAGPELRSQALAEMLRVLKPGGILCLTDIEGREDDLQTLRNLGADAVALTVLHPWRDRLLQVVTFGSFAPFTVTARKAVA
jgi:arsenite methyltransferase